MSMNTQAESPKHKPARGISGSTLKWIAMISMLIDHIGAAYIEPGLLPFLLKQQGAQSSGYQLWANVDTLLRCIGRMAFPIYCFLLVEGIFHTRSRGRYLGRLFVFALLSEVPFDLAFCGTLCSFEHQNVLFSLFLGALAVSICVRCMEKGQLSRTKMAVVLVVFGILATVLCVDYSYVAIVVIFTFYLLYHEELLRDIVAAVMLLGAGHMELAGYVAFLPMHYYNGQRGRQPKYIFYLFYPLHLLVIAGIRIWIFGH